MRSHREERDAVSSMEAVAGIGTYYWEYAAILNMNATLFHVTGMGGPKAIQQIVTGNW